MGTYKEKISKKESFAQINTKSFLIVFILLLAIIIISGFLSYVIPQGSYQRDDFGMIIDGTFVLGEIKGISFFKVLSAPVRVFFSSDALTIIMISVLLLIMSGVFNLIEKTGGISIVIGKTVKKFSAKKRLVILVTTLVFMAFGSFFGMFEELVTLLPLIIVLVLSLGYDSLTGLGVCMMSACFGFSAAITNPFSVGIVANIAHTHVFDGVWLRIIFFILVFLAVSAFLSLHIKKITKNPAKSLTFEMDRDKLNSIQYQSFNNVSNERKIFITYAVFFCVQLVVLVLIASIRSISGLAIPILALSFLIGGIVCGLIICEKISELFKYLGSGVVAMLPAVVMIALASSVKLVMTESGIIDTVMHAVISMLVGKSKFVCILLVYLLILFLQIFIGSSSAKIMLIMPIILPVATDIGLSPTIVILTYCIADGFTDVIMPTNPVLLIGLSMAGVSYGKWVRWTWKFQLLMFALQLK